MHKSIITLGDIPHIDILDIVTDERTVWYNNQEFGTDGMSSFVFLKDGSVYASDYCEPCSFDPLYLVRK